MPLQFNADEILQVAEQIERNGSRYYRKAASNAADPRVKQVLTGLATMEDRHEETFADLRKHLANKDRAETVFDPQGETEAYLRAMADGCVFDVESDPSEQLTGKESPTEIFTKAIQLEKDSIVFYLGIKDMVGASLGQKKIDDIIQEEMNHITVLSNQLRNLQ
ncbi:MAG TPA: ferritin family protein [Tepidisphaeraceae bacterium]|nr:ferritin family protein [Tepidisphaeraceae bacterium]